MRGSRFADPDGFPVDGSDDAVPACEGFFEREFDGGDEMVTAAFESGVFFLWRLLVWCLLQEKKEKRKDKERKEKK